VFPPGLVKGIQGYSDAKAESFTSFGHNGEVFAVFVFRTVWCMADVISQFAMPQHLMEQGGHILLKQTASDGSHSFILLDLLLELLLTLLFFTFVFTHKHPPNMGSGKLSPTLFILINIEADSYMTLSRFSKAPLFSKGKSRFLNTELQWQRLISDTSHRF
jgi:hypothetical protein